MFSTGELKADDQEKMLSVLNKKVEEVYRSCIGDNEANIRCSICQQFAAVLFTYFRMSFLLLVL